MLHSADSSSLHTKVTDVVGTERENYSSHQAVRLHTCRRAADSGVMSVFMDLNVSFTADRSSLRSAVETAAHRECPRGPCGETRAQRGKYRRYRERS